MEQDMILWITLLVLMLVIAALPAFTMLLEYYQSSPDEQPASESRVESHQEVLG
jgi:hypothetical protein